MSTPDVGYTFETTFLAQLTAGGARLEARYVNGHESPLPILCDDRRVLPGQRVKVRVTAQCDTHVTVEFLGLSQLDVTNVYIPPLQRKQFEILLCSGRSILLEGPQGAGKTTISRELARALGMEYVFFNCSICFEPADFVGALQLVLDADGRAKTEWVPTEVLRAIVAANEQPLQRFLIFLDELNRCRSVALNGIMSAIDSSRRIFDPRHNRYLPIPDNVQWIAAVNSGKQFTGTYKLDLAQLDRFAVLKLDYPPEDEEVRILHARYDMLKAKLVRKVVKIANLIRRDDTIATDLSMRATDEACLFLSYPGAHKGAGREDLRDTLATSFCNRLPGSATETATEAHTAFQIIERHTMLGDAVAEEGE